MSGALVKVSEPGGNPGSVDYHVGMPQRVIDGWTAKIATLAPRKVKNWKGTATNATGRWAIVRYSQEGIQTVHGLMHFETKTDGTEKRAMYNMGVEVKDWVTVVPL